MGKYERVIFGFREIAFNKGKIQISGNEHITNILCVGNNQLYVKVGIFLEIIGNKAFYGKAAYCQCCTEPKLLLLCAICAQLVTKIDVVMAHGKSGRTQIFAGLGKMKLFSLIDEKLGAVIILDIMYML